MKECSKSIPRRQRNPNFANRFFVGSGVDIGGAPDPLQTFCGFFPKMKGAKIWDLKQGDAQFMNGVADQTFDFVHSSHCLEHLVDPIEGLKNWFRILKPGGHLIVTVPEEDMYEQGQFPSTWNTDHKWTFAINKVTSWSDKSLNILELIRELGDAAELVLLERLDGLFWDVLPRFDQTQSPVAECGIEFVIRRRTAKELEQGGRLPPPGKIGDGDVFCLTGRRINRPSNT